MNNTLTIICRSIFTLFLLSLLSSAAYAFPNNSLRPGGVAVLSVAPSHNAKPYVSYNNKPIALVKGQQNWLAIVGISLDAKTGQHKIDIKDSSGKTSIQKFTVKPHKYKTQYLTIKNKNKVNPNNKSMKRIEREFVMKKKLKSTFSNSSPKLNFIRPVAGRDSGRYGLRRILNKQKRNPHSGMDIAAPQGRSVKATESGTVLWVGNLFFSGNVIYIDHGNGVLSLYAHLSKMNVRKGQQVKRGEIIGKVGKTGRVTGAHLHWTVFLNGNAVDPALFIAKQ
ncbi:peptidoglycan DD-metalloendopeptidase family protein [Cocleimonas sp. KMM 6892]|uniref:peptidoglycan DD-metalloendopeptidase family protein n=1 Tax=unclassified Cocleimonas TaxID=2639732 RepID=UPI002DB895C1|nr:MULTISPECIES: peptidoglycan DD-metalloendopeptidase family protein [unclassified Cocleimonas]MEB8433899.1 peptidoglycan DD-metalloendopeptidase family protein [Cocleimonas sp. KMM 6892]MEC4716710.1 peptidoglycan DD-metalloendopeptidase family protein [Cocleimonas sp. KMM 6895]MEC4746135.1 peptidoglycan DD-metalloendopeptidase family protein [Cocleimonas sp. KMM 6896]